MLVISTWNGQRPLGNVICMRSLWVLISFVVLIILEHVAKVAASRYLGLIVAVGALRRATCIWQLNR